MEWAEAFNNVGVAFAVALAVVGFFWMMTR